MFQKLATDFQRKYQVRVKPDKKTPQVNTTDNRPAKTIKSKTPTSTIVTDNRAEMVSKIQAAKAKSTPTPTPTPTPNPTKPKLSKGKLGLAAAAATTLAAGAYLLKGKQDKQEKLAATIAELIDNPDKKRRKNKRAKQAPNPKASNPKTTKAKTLFSETLFPQSLEDLTLVKKPPLTKKHLALAALAGATTLAGGVYGYSKLKKEAASNHKAKTMAESLDELSIDAEINKIMDNFAGKKPPLTKKHLALAALAGGATIAGGAYGYNKLKKEAALNLLGTHYQIQL